MFLKESIFNFRRNGITVLSSYVYGDPRNEFEREPFIVKFKVTNAGKILLLHIYSFGCLAIFKRIKLILDD